MLSNLIIICDIDRQQFSKWRSSLDEPLNVGKWVELPSFHRILMVFETVQQAEIAYGYICKQFADLHIFYGPNMPLKTEPTYLSLPDAGRLWFTSPPASPPNGWEVSNEEPPNMQTHHDDDFNQQLQLALAKYQAELDGETADGPDVCVLHEGSGDVPKLQVQFTREASGGKRMPKTAMP